MPMTTRVRDKKITGRPDLPQKRRPRRAALLAVTVAALGILLALVLPGAWQETQRREAYLPQLEAQAQRSPYDGRLLALLGGRRMEAGEYDKAADALRRALAAGESDDALWLNLAAATAAMGDSPRAIADLRLGVHSLPASQPLQDALGRALSAGPSDPLPVVISPQGPQPLIAAYSSGSFLNKPVEWWGRHHPEQSGYATRADWARERPDDAQAQRLWGLALMQNRRLPEAGAVLAHAVALAPRSPAANLAMADWLNEARLPSKSLVQYVVCLQLRPGWLPALLGMGQAALNAELPSYAVSAYQRATEIAPGSVDAWIGLGRAEAAEPDFINPALSAFETARRLAPDRTDFYTDYAAAFRKAGRLAPPGNSPMSEAERLLRRRIDAAPNDYWAHYLLANILLHSAPSPTTAAVAEAETRKALELAPGDPLSEIQLARLLLDRNDLHGAIDLLSKALTVQPNNAPAIRTLGQAYARNGQPDLARKMFARSKTLKDRTDQLKILRDRERANPMDAAAHEQLAALYQQTGTPNKAAAERNMAQMIRKNPQDAAAQLTTVRTLVQTVLQTH